MLACVLWFSLFGLLAFGFKPNLVQAISLLFASEWCFIDCYQNVSKKNGVPFCLGLKPKSFWCFHAWYCQRQFAMRLMEDVCAALAPQLSAKILTRPAHPGHHNSRAR